MNIVFNKTKYIYTQIFHNNNYSFFETLILTFGMFCLVISQCYFLLSILNVLGYLSSFFNICILTVCVEQFDSHSINYLIFKRYVMWGGDNQCCNNYNYYNNTYDEVNYLYTGILVLIVIAFISALVFLSLKLSKNIYSKISKKMESYIDMKINLQLEKINAKKFSPVDIKDSNIINLDTIENGFNKKYDKLLIENINSQKYFSPIEQTNNQLYEKSIPDDCEFITYSDVE